MTAEATNDISLNGGVLIIGSLLWDTDEIRVDWRTNYLDFDNIRLVPAPIRYGRVSSERNCTFTMVFSSECKQQEKLGTAWFVPFTNNPVDLEKLWVQCSELIKAETKKRNPSFHVFNWSWGALGLCINPKAVEQNSKKLKSIEILKKKWQEKYGKQKPLQPDEFNVGEEASIVSKDGLLQIDWPSEMNDIDFFITTATKPEVKKYPSAENIADRMVVNEYSKYFFENIAQGITTFQDEQIKKNYDQKLSSENPVL